MKKIGPFHRGFTLLILVFVLSIGLFMFLPPNVMYADTSNPVNTETTEQTDGATGASQQTDGTAAASQPKFEHYEPLPIKKPIHREANNTLLGSGLVFAALTFGGAGVMDKKRNR